MHGHPAVGSAAMIVRLVRLDRSATVTISRGETATRCPAFQDWPVAGWVKGEYFLVYPPIHAGCRPPIGGNGRAVVSRHVLLVKLDQFSSLADNTVPSHDD